eukprot:gene4667-6556_t
MYRDPTDEEIAKLDNPEDVVNNKIAIWWDGDNIYYPGIIAGYNPRKNHFRVKYDNDTSGIIYDEDLSSTKWRIFDENLIGKTLGLEGDPNHKVAKKANSKLSYAGMVLESIIDMNEKSGSSLQSIRKYLQTVFNMRNQQVASFNSLTMKAINKLIATGEIEKVVGTRAFRLTPAEKDRRKKEMERNEKMPINVEKSSDSRSSNSSSFFVGTAAENNKDLRKYLITAKIKRDKYLIERIDILNPFLPRKNYLTKRIEKLAVMNISVDRMLDADVSKLLEDDIVNARDSDESDDIEQSQLNDDAVEINPIPNNDDPDNEVIVVPEDEGKIFAKIPDGVRLIKQSPLLTAELHDHQIQGISWMVHMFLNGMPMILGDQMGLGKTIQSIGFLAYLHSELNKKGPHLIVVPLSVMSNWLTEIERFCPFFRAVRFHGPIMERNRIKSEELKDLSEFDIVVTTFEMMVSEVNFFRRRFVWTTVIVDEGHRLKNEKSQLSEKLRIIPCLCKVILTGTPMQNNLRELWSMLHYLATDIFSVNSAEKFGEGFDLTKGIIDSRVLRRARKLLGIFMLRRVKDQVNVHLPSRRELTILVPMTPLQIELYKQLLYGLDCDIIETVMKETEKAKLIDNIENQVITNDSISNLTLKKTSSSNTLNNTNSSDSEWRKLMNLLLQLRKICNHSYLLPGVAPDPYEISEEIVSGSGKLLMLDRILPKLKADGHRVLLFSQFTSMLDILEDYCELRDYSFVRLDGETNRVRRRLDVRRFNAPNSQLFIFLISTRAGGLGLNLASADTVILYDSDWNPQVDLQAMERAHRIGQIKPVRIYRLICHGSVEERMVSRAEKKLFLNAMVAEADPDENLAEDHDENNDELNHALGIGGTSISKSELASLIRFGANAIFNTVGNENGVENDSNMSEEMLDLLLERQGRDVVANAVTHDSKGVDEMDDINRAQLTVKARMESIQEVDLRQLGNVLYSKKKGKGSSSMRNSDINERNIVDNVTSYEINDNDTAPWKRIRKERITLVSGLGSGYGSSFIPVLSDTIESNSLTQLTSVPSLSRGRSWTHRTFCVLCGQTSTLDGMLKCAHCPWVFHATCADSYSLSSSRSTGMFVCPQHKCACCNRNTSAAGGMLFRCIGCLTSYCEDCLPQDEIESIGRCKELESSLGYSSKQSYYVRCTSCYRDIKPKSTALSSIDIITENNNMENDPNGEIIEAKGGHDDSVMVNDEEELITQKMLIKWEEYVPPPPPMKKNRNKKGSGKNSKKRSQAKPSDEDELVNAADQSDDDVPMEIVYPYSHLLLSEKVPNKCTLDQGIVLLLGHPATQFLMTNVRHENSSAIDGSLANIYRKIEQGRYRSVTQFVGELKAVVDEAASRFVKLNNKDSSKQKVSQTSGEVREAIKILRSFLNDQLVDCLQLKS